MSVSLFDYEKLEEENAKLHAEIERLKRECQGMGRLIEKSICVPTEEYKNMVELQLLVESHFSDLRICWDFLKQLENGIMSDGDHVDTQVSCNASMIMENLKARAALKEET